MLNIPKAITTDLVEAIKNTVAELATEAPATHKLCRYADLRIEVTEEKHAGAENGTSKYAGEDSQFACGIRVLAGDGAVAPGYFGQMLGKPDLPRLAQTLASGLKHAYERALANAREKIRIRHKYKELGEALADTRLAPVEAYRDTVKAEYALDPRQVSLDDMVRYITDLARAAVKLAHAPALRSSDKDAVVVTDPHFNALLAHEIIGHPTELDRALKMETAYAGRSWLLRTLNDTMVGKPVASALVSAYSDPALPGFGHYKYDHEGTLGRKVMHIEKGIFKGFMNNRQTAAILNVPPNGSCLATEAHLVPLVRMSTTVFGSGARAPEDIIHEVDKG